MQKMMLLMASPWQQFFGITHSGIVILHTQKKGGLSFKHKQIVPLLNAPMNFAFLKIYRLVWGRKDSDIIYLSVYITLWCFKKKNFEKASGLKRHSMGRIHKHFFDQKDKINLKEFWNLWALGADSLNNQSRDRGELRSQTLWAY